MQKNSRGIILASQSPRRKELLARLDLPFSIANNFSYNETIPKTMEVDKVAEHLSVIKSEAFPHSLEQKILLTADTLVISANKILGKPKTESEAYSMLTLLSDSCHRVITGVTLRTELALTSFSETTKVTFTKISESEKEYYIRKYKPYDKAGAYGIQEWIGCVGIEKIEGCYYNVMGLPLAKLYKQLIEIEAFEV